ncbi:hypothetical protein MHK_009405 [Candidatus Magnetomorum sp. HK-1]|nr:hypothetical protein MHK_009405 [Candidatus Magnetomorum sp. HK-1]
MRKANISGKVDITIRERFKAKCEKNGQTVSEVISLLVENYIADVPICSFDQFKEQYNTDSANIQNLLKKSVGVNLNFINAFAQHINKMFSFIVAGIKLLGYQNKSIEKWFDSMPVIPSITTAN